MAQEEVQLAEAQDPCRGRQCSSKGQLWAQVLIFSFLKIGLRGLLPGGS